MPACCHVPALPHPCTTTGGTDVRLMLLSPCSLPATVALPSDEGGEAPAGFPPLPCRPQVRVGLRLFFCTLGRNLLANGARF